MRFGDAGRVAIEGGRVKVNRRGEIGSVGGGRWPTSEARALRNFSNFLGEGLVIFWCGSEAAENRGRFC